MLKIFIEEAQGLGKRQRPLWLSRAAVRLGVPLFHYEPEYAMVSDPCLNLASRSP